MVKKYSFNPPKNHTTLGDTLIVLIIIFIFIRNKIRFLEEYKIVI